MLTKISTVNSITSKAVLLLYTNYSLTHVILNYWYIYIYIIVTLLRPTVAVIYSLPAISVDNYMPVTNDDEKTG